MGVVSELVAIIFSLSAATILCVGVATPYWRTRGTEYSGIWQNCYAPDVCFEITWDTNGTLALARVVARGACIAAIVLVGIGLLLHVLSFCCESGSRGTAMKAEGTFQVLAGIIILIGAGVYTGLAVIDTAVDSVSTQVITNLGNLTTDSITQQFGYSLYLVWVAGVLYIVAGIFGCIAGCCVNSNETAPAPATIQATNQMTTIQLQQQQTQFVQQPTYLPV